MTVCLPSDPALALALTLVPALAALALLTWLAWRAVAMRAPWRPTRGTAAAWGVALLAAVAAWMLAPGPTRVYYDEFQHAESTANLALSGDPHGCCAWRDDLCEPGGPLLWPLATHVLSLPALRLTSAAPDVAAALLARRLTNALAGLLLPLLVWGWAGRMTRNSLAAWTAAVLLALSPARWLLLPTAGLMTAALALLAGLLWAVEWSREVSWRRAAAPVLALLLLTLHARLEMALVLPWALWRVAGGGPRVRWGRAGCLALAAALGLAPLVWMYASGAVGGAAGWTKTIGEVLGHFARHAPGNVAFLLAGFAAPALLLPLAALGLVWRRRDGAAWALLGMAGGSFVFYSAYHIGEFSPDKTFDAWRYALPIVLWLTPLAGLGLSAAAERTPLADRPFAVGFLALVLGAAPLAYRQEFLGASHPLAAQDRLARDAAAALPADAVLLTMETAYLRALTRRPDIVEATRLGSGDPATERAAREGRAVYFRPWGEPPPAKPGWAFDPWGPDGADGQGAAWFRVRSVLAD